MCDRPTVNSVTCGGTWRRTCSPGIRSISALRVLRNALYKSTFTYLLTYLQNSVKLGVKCRSWNSQGRPTCVPCWVCAAERGLTRVDRYRDYWDKCRYNQDAHSTRTHVPSSSWNPRSTHRQTDIQTDRQRDRQTDIDSCPFFFICCSSLTNKQTQRTWQNTSLTSANTCSARQTALCLSVCLCGAAICQQQTDDSLCRYIHTFGTQLYKSRGLMLQQSSIRQHPSTLNRCLLYCTTVHARCVGIARWYEGHVKVKWLTSLSPRPKRSKTALTLPPCCIEITRTWSSSLSQIRNVFSLLCLRPTQHLLTYLLTYLQKPLNVNFWPVICLRSQIR